jgi:hypothetical protein
LITHDLAADGWKEESKGVGLRSEGRRRKERRKEMDNDFHFKGKDITKIHTYL